MSSICYITVLYRLTGIYILALFSTRIFTDVGLTITAAQWAAVGMVVVNVVVTAVAMAVVERFGRRVLLFGKRRLFVFELQAVIDLQCPMACALFR